MNFKYNVVFVNDNKDDNEDNNDETRSIQIDR